MTIDWSALFRDIYFPPSQNDMESVSPDVIRSLLLVGKTSSEISTELQQLYPHISPLPEVVGHYHITRLDFRLIRSSFLYRKSMASTLTKLKSLY